MITIYFDIICVFVNICLVMSSATTAMTTTYPSNRMFISLSKYYKIKDCSH